MVCGGIAHWGKSQLIVVEGNMTAVKYRDEILRPVAAPLLQQRQLILQQDTMADNNIILQDWPPYSPNCDDLDRG